MKIIGRGQPFLFTDFVPAGPITGSSGIASEEAFGSGGTVALASFVIGGSGIVSEEAFGSGGTLILFLVGSAGIASAEAFGSGGSAIGPVSGSSGIASEEAFGSGGDIRFSIEGFIGIPSEEAFGAGGQVLGPITGFVGIVSGEVFGSGGTVAGPITGSAGIASAEIFGSGGTATVTGPVSGSAGIPSGEAFGADGLVTILVSGSAGIPSAEGFGTTGDVAMGIVGYFGIESGEAFGTSGIVSNDRTWQLFIGGVDRTALLGVNSFSADLDITTTGAATLNLEDPNGRYRPKFNEEVIYLYSGRRIFAGKVQRSKVSTINGTKRTKIYVQCVQLQRIADDRTYAKTWEGPTIDLATVLRDIVAVGLSGENVTYEPDPETWTITAKRLVFDGGSVAQAFQRVQSHFGCNIWIDNYGNLKVFRSRWDTAPYVLRDQETNHMLRDAVWKDLSIEYDGSQYRNTQGSRTTTPTSGQKTADFVGDGVTRRWTLKQPTTAAPAIRVNGVAAVVVDYVGRQSVSWDFLYEAGSNSIQHNGAKPVLTAMDTIDVVYPAGSLDVATSTTNSAAVATMASRSGGSGIIEAVTPARNVRDAGAAEAINTTQLAKYGGEIMRVSWLSGRPFWELGQVVHSAINEPPLHAWLMISKLTVKEVDATYLEYTIEAQAAVPPEITEFEVEDNGDGTFTVTMGGGFDLTGLPDGSTFTIGGIDSAGNFGEDSAAIVAMTAAANGSNWTLTLILDRWLASTPADTVAIRNVVIEATGGQGLSFGQPVLRINGGWVVDSIDKDAKKIIIKTGEDGNPVVNFDGLRYTNPPDGRLTATAGAGSINGAFSGDVDGDGNLTFTTGQVTHITSIAITPLAGRRYQVRLNLDQIPQAIAGDSCYVGNVQSAGSVDELNGTYKLDIVPSSPAQYVEFTTSQLCKVLSVQLTNGGDPDTWTVRVNVDTLPDTSVGDTATFSNVRSHTSQPAAAGDNSDRASRRRFGGLYGINGNWVLSAVASSLPGWVEFETNDGSNPKRDLTGYVLDNAGDGYCEFTPPGNPALDLAHFEYKNPNKGTASFSAANGNAPVDLTHLVGTNPPAVDTGYFYVGQPPLPTTPPGATNPTSPAGTPTHRIVAVNNQTAEVTTADDHGFQTSYPEPNHNEVCIFGVTHPEHINLAATRVTVTGPRTFIAEDANLLQLAYDLAFVNDGHGQCFDTKMHIAVSSNPKTDMLDIVGSAVAGAQSNSTETITFLLANSMPGLPTRPLQTGVGLTNDRAFNGDLGVLEEVNAYVKTPADGGPIKIDVTLNGQSVFAAGSLLTIPAGSTAVVRVSEFDQTPKVVEKGDKFNVNVVQVGSNFAGCNAVVNTRIRT